MEKYLAKERALSLAGVTYTPDTLKAAFQAEIDLTKAVDEQRAELRQRLVALRAARANARAAWKALKAYLLGNHGTQAVGVLGDFGMKAPKRPGPKTVKSKLESVTKARARREASRLTRTAD